jgi:chromosome segregation ATPase
MYSQLQDYYVSLNAEYERLTEHYVGLQGKFDDITQERDSLQTQIIDIGIKDEALERGMQSAGDEQGKLKAQLFSVTQEADQCQHRYQTLRDELQEQRTHCRSITEHFAGMDKALADSRMECTQLKERLDTLKP